MDLHDFQTVMGARPRRHRLGQLGRLIAVIQSKGDIFRSGDHVSQDARESSDIEPIRPISQAGNN